MDGSGKRMRILEGFVILPLRPPACCDWVGGERGQEGGGVRIVHHGQIDPQISQISLQIRTGTLGIS